MHPYFGWKLLSVLVLLTFALQPDAAVVSGTASRCDSNSFSETVDSVIYIMIIALLSIFQEGGLEENWVK